MFTLASSSAPFTNILIVTGGSLVFELVPVIVTIKFPSRSEAAKEALKLVKSNSIPSGTAKEKVS